jgi:hypothetical protein
MAYKSNTKIAFFSPAGEENLLTVRQPPLAHILFVDATFPPYSSTLPVN